MTVLRCDRVAAAVSHYGPGWADNPHASSWVNGAPEADFVMLEWFDRQAAVFAAHREVEAARVASWLRSRSKSMRDLNAILDLDEAEAIAVFGDGLADAILQGVHNEGQS